ncbi:uncharacterized protein TNCV_1732711 [Trichonephila clavipes]|nr:uncharacterized protein TNCV_1732711 [Trichonephila clavipes]
MPPNTLRVHTEYVLVKSVGPKVLWAESRVQGTGEHFPPLQFHAKIGEVKVGGVAIYRSFGGFHRANSYCHLYGVQGQQQAYLSPLATMNFVSLDLTTSDSLNDRAAEQLVLEIYRKQKNSHVVTTHMNITYRQTSGLGIVSDDIGDICAEERLFEKGQ